MSLVALQVLTPENQLKGILLPDIDAWNAEILRKKVLKVDICERSRVFLVFFIYVCICDLVIKCMSHGKRLN